MSTIIQQLEREQLRDDVPTFHPGDTVRVHAKVIEGGKERIQVFEGVVIAMKQGAVRTTFTVRKISHTVGVERVFLLHSPKISRIEVTRRGKVRRAKLYYLRNKVGRQARIKERRFDTTKGAAKAAARAAAAERAAQEAAAQEAAANQAAAVEETAPAVESAPVTSAEETTGA